MKKTVTDYPNIEVGIQDLKMITYFIFMKYKYDTSHRQGTSSKSDLIGGFMDRWVNRISEFVIFNNFLKGKGYRIASDYFLYDNKTKKDASDLLGLECSNGKIIPFVKFNDGSWQRESKMPRIEIKTIKQKQYLVSVRDTQMTNDYYVFVESNFNNDYLAILFNKEVFSKNIFNKINIKKKDFIIQDSSNLLQDPFEIKKPKEIGTVRLIGTYSKKDLEKLTTLYETNEVFWYLKTAEILEKEIKKQYKRKRTKFVSITNKSYENTLKGKKYLPFYTNAKSIKVLGGSMSTLYLEVPKNTKINRFNFQKGGVIKIQYSKMDRTSGWREHMTSKEYLKILGTDKTDELLKLLDTIYEKQK